MAWRLYAQRSTTGEWLDTNVGASLDVTWQLNGAGRAKGLIPTSLDTPRGADGRPLWLERGTTLYAEEDGQLKWVGLCSWQRRTSAGRELEFKGMKWGYDLIGYTSRIRQWEPHPYDVVADLLDNAHGQPDGDLGMTLVRQGAPDGYPGDEQPPEDRPKKVNRRKGETSAEYAARQARRREDQAEWDKKYGDRRPYELAWWEAPYVGEELSELARELPFDYYERHEWADREALTRRSELVVTARKGTQRPDLALVEGVNIAVPLDPTTDADTYGNQVILLGAGEGSKMRRAAIGARDGRVRTTRYGEAKHVRNEARLRSLARRRFERMEVSVRLEEATMRGELGGLELGDEVPVESSVFNGWCRVYGITRNTATGNVVLTFTDTGSSL